FYIARRGDTAKTIADVFDISIDDLKMFNPELNINKINPGKWIRVIEDRQPATPNIRQQNPCSADWTYYEKTKKCLKLSPNSGFFNDIDSYCKSNGATLVTIHSADENHFLAESLVQKIVEITYLAKSTNIDFHDWQARQPDNVDGNQHNVIFGPLVKGKSESGHWDDIDGETNKFHGVCQKKATNTAKIEQPITTTSKPSTTSVPSTTIKQPITTTSKPSITSKSSTSRPSTRIAQPITTTSRPSTTLKLFQQPENHLPFIGHNDGCHDANLCCPYWAQQAQCEANPRWMLTNCRLSCGYCISSINYRDSQGNGN
uniref:Uncharacterized protein n=1 Tax=Acrobeloides nanus TaxID=290746 RepID=A0A914E5M8_9BILA